MTASSATRKASWLWVIAGALLAGCAPLPRAGDPSALWQPSPNFDERRPGFVVIHATGSDTAAHAMRTLTDSRRRVSAHYLIARDGTVYQLVDERARAWHAGVSSWGANTDLNSVSLGIELDNNGDEPFPDVQIAALIKLLEGIRGRYRIAPPNYVGHGDVAPTRKVDPSRHFPWATLARHGFGLWCDPPWPEPASTGSPALALRALGYDVSELDAAVRAFKRHFTQEDTTTELTLGDRGMLYCLLEKKGALPP